MKKKRGKVLCGKSERQDPRYFLLHCYKMYRYFSSMASPV